MKMTKVILTGEKAEIEKIIRENSIRVGRGSVNFSEYPEERGEKEIDDKKPEKAPPTTSKKKKIDIDE
ncbi:MAG: hypothetical protein FWF54_03605 [Candidatus Azobacteroides sp.]|nr:hypothetical protein [Candidatus Azobacteroides sp.]